MQTRQDQGHLSEFWVIFQGIPAKDPGFAVHLATGLLLSAVKCSSIVGKKLLL
jgi:hypothetical protein